MDIQLHATDKELDEFPEERSDQIGIKIVDKADTGLLIQKAQPLQKAHTASTASHKKPWKTGEPWTTK